IVGNLIVNPREIMANTGQTITITCSIEPPTDSVQIHPFPWNPSSISRNHRPSLASIVHLRNPSSISGIHPLPMEPIINSLSLESILVLSLECKIHLKSSSSIPGIHRPSLESIVHLWNPLSTSGIHLLPLEPTINPLSLAPINSILEIDLPFLEPCHHLLESIVHLRNPSSALGTRHQSLSLESILVRSLESKIRLRSPSSVLCPWNPKSTHLPNLESGFHLWYPYCIPGSSISCWNHRRSLVAQ
ncbi:unnamed protein product, partial [Nesidiocoris tenuis]